MKKNLLFILLIVSITSFAQQNKDSLKISDIVNNPGNYDNEFVTIKGIVTQYTPGSAKTTAYYLLKGDFGGVIKVNTSTPKPETHKVYSVSGTVIIDQVNREAYIIENSRNLLTTDKTTDKITDKTSTTSSEGGKVINYTNMILITGGVLLLIILIIALFLFKREKKKPAYPSGGFYSPSGNQSPTHTKGNKTPHVMPNDNDFKTIKIATDAAPKTMKLLPGYLEITAGADTGKKFSISGYPTLDGSIISIGRETVSGDRKYAHIQLKEQTVSHKQAEIIAVGNNLEVKNLSKVNLTQLNGVEIQPGQKLKLEPNSIIKTGEVEFAYRI